MHGSSRIAVALHAFEIDAEGRCRVTLIHTVGDAVLTNHASAAQHRALPDLDELVNPGLPADDHVVSNMNVAGKADVVGNDGVVSDDAVMGDMDIGHQQIVVSDNSYSLVLYGSYRERAVFANNVIVTDNQLSFLAAVFFYPEDRYRSLQRHKSCCSYRSWYGR